ncbi:MAG: hypothetical protein ABSE73_18225 [Planctomycetota bacterium]
MDEADQTLLQGLIYGTLHDEDPLTGVDFAVKVAVCAKLSGGDQASYGKAIRKVLGGDRELFEVFPRSEIEQTARDFLRASRKARTDPLALDWLRLQFESSQTPQYVKHYLIEAERSLCRVFMAGPAK